MIGLVSVAQRKQSLDIIFLEMEAESKFMKCLWRLMIWSGILFTAQNIYRCGKKGNVPLIWTSEQ